MLVGFLSHVNPGSSIGDMRNRVATDEQLKLRAHNLWEINESERADLHRDVVSIMRVSQIMGDSGRLLERTAFGHHCVSDATKSSVCVVATPGISRPSRPVIFRERTN
jgi:hypothetical protein